MARVSEVKMVALVDGGKETISCNKRNFGEMAGRAMAECTAVCCCCPCTVMNVLWTVVTLPTRVLMKVKRKIEKSKKQKKVMLERSDSFWPHGDLEREARELIALKAAMANRGREKEEVDGEKELWELFYSTGFWRSPSQKET